MARKLLPPRTLNGINPDVKKLWYEKHNEPEAEIFDGCPSWMQSVDENYYVEDRDNKIIVKAVSFRLTPKEQEVINYRFFEQMTLEEISKIYDVHRERIRQIEAKALRKMRYAVHHLGVVSLWRGNIKKWVEKLTVEQRILVMGEENYKKLCEIEDARRVEEDERAKVRRKKILNAERERQLWRQKIHDRHVLLDSLWQFSSDMLKDMKEVAEYTHDEQLAKKISNVLYVRNVCTF